MFLWLLDYHRCVYPSNLTKFKQHNSIYLKTKMFSNLVLRTNSISYLPFLHFPAHKIVKFGCMSTKTLMVKRYSKESSKTRVISHSYQKSSTKKREELPSILDITSEVSKKEKVILYKVLNDIADDLENLSIVKETAFANARIKKLVNYMLPKGITSGSMFVIADRYFAKQRQESNTLLKTEDEHFRLAAILFWAIEMFMRNIGMQDDVIDGNQCRNNLQAWNTQDGTGIQAVRDANIIDKGALILIKYFKSTEYYTDLLEQFIEFSYRVDVGISQMEMIRPSPNQLTPKPVKLLSAGKKYAYGGFFPHGALVSAMIINKAVVPELMGAVKDIGLDIGLYAGLSEDYIDCYADVSVNERAPTDIPEGKQSWLYWKALELAHPTQAQILLDSYGKYDVDCISTVKKIYKDLCIQEHMNHMFQDMRTDITNRIAQLPHKNVPWTAYFYLMNYYDGVRGGNYARP